MHTLCIRGLVLFFISTTLCALSEKEALTQKLFDKRCEISKLGLMIKERSNLMRTHMNDMAIISQDLLDNKTKGKTAEERKVISQKMWEDFNTSIKRIFKNYQKKDSFEDVLPAEFFDGDMEEDVDFFNHLKFHWIYCFLEREFLKELVVRYEKAIQECTILVNKLEDIHA